MLTATVRKQGASAVITLPALVLSILEIRVGDQVELSLDKRTLVVRPLKRRRRYTIAELLKGVTQEKMDRLILETQDSQTGKSVGEEEP